MHREKTRPTEPGLQNLLLYLPGGDRRKDLTYVWASLVAQMVNNVPAVREIQVGSLGLEDPLEKGMGPPPFPLSMGNH